VKLAILGKPLGYVIDVYTQQVRHVPVAAETQESSPAGVDRLPKKNCLDLRAVVDFVAVKASESHKVQQGSARAR
jgi:hypothetical protein